MFPVTFELATVVIEDRRREAQALHAFRAAARNRRRARHRPSHRPASARVAMGGVPYAAKSNMATDPVLPP